MLGGTLLQAMDLVARVSTGMVVVAKVRIILHHLHPKVLKKHADVVLIVPGLVLLVTVLLLKHLFQLLHHLLHRIRQPPEAVLKDKIGYLNQTTPMVATVLLNNMSCSAC